MSEEFFANSEFLGEAVELLFSLFSFFSLLFFFVFFLFFFWFVFFCLWTQFGGGSRQRTLYAKIYENSLFSHRVYCVS